jgi:hypothetical protein
LTFGIVAGVPLCSSYLVVLVYEGTHRIARLALRRPAGDLDGDARRTLLEHGFLLDAAGPLVATCGYAAAPDGPLRPGDAVIVRVARPDTSTALKDDRPPVTEEGTSSSAGGRRTDGPPRAKGSTVDVGI